MLLKIEKIFRFITLVLLVIQIFSCRINKNLKLPLEDLENCQKWNWIALAETNLWTPKAEAYFTYVPHSNQTIKNLTQEELILCGTWESIYLSSYFSGITTSYKSQYENSDIKGNLYFCKDRTGYFDNKTFSKRNNCYLDYRFSFEWKIQNDKVYIRPISLKNLENIYETYEFKEITYYSIGKISLDNKYLIQVENWNFRRIPIKDSFIGQKYGINKLENDCLRYKYTWIEDWGMPILQDYVNYNNNFTLEELNKMNFYK